MALRRSPFVSGGRGNRCQFGKVRVRVINADALAGVGDLARRERPREGLRVLELGFLIAGPFATRVMAESGAEVV